MDQRYAKHFRIRARGLATLRVERDHVLSIYNGNAFPVLAIGKPAPKCRVRLLVKGKAVDVEIGDLL